MRGREPNALGPLSVLTTAFLQPAPDLLSSQPSAASLSHLVSWLVASVGQEVSELNL